MTRTETLSGELIASPALAVSRYPTRQATPLLVGRGRGTHAVGLGFGEAEVREGGDVVSSCNRVMS